MIARAQESTDRWPPRNPPAPTTPDAAAVAARRSAAACAPTCRPPSCTRTRSAHGEGLIAADGPLVVRTGKHTGRSPQDKFIVDEPTSRDEDLVGRGQPADQPRRTTTASARRLVAYCAEKDLYSQDCFIGADPAHQRRLRVYTETAWASIFARNLFRRPTAAQLAGFAPNFTIICVPSFQADPATEGTRTGTAILVHLERMEIIIVGTEYAGEIKKSRVHGHELPDARRGRPADALVGQRRRGRRPRRLLRPVGDRQDDPLGRSGAQPHRRRRARLGPDGLFNFEGGCYAKTIRLSPMYEPDIFQTTRRFGTVLENVDLDPTTRELDLDSERFTENTRGAYPLDFIGNADPTGMTGQPTHRRASDRRRVRRAAADLRG